MTTLQQIQVSQAQKEVTANANFQAVSPAALFANSISTTTGLTWGYYGGVVLNSGTYTTIADGTISLTDNTTNYVEADAAGTVYTNTSAFTAGRVPLQTVDTVSGQVSSFVDYRIFPLVQGVVQTAANFTPGFTGFSADPTVSARYQLIGNVCFIYIDTTAVGTSNATDFTITGLPFTAAGVTAGVMYVGSATDNSLPVMCFGSVSGTTLTLYNGTTFLSTSWTALGDKGASISFFYETA